MRIIGIDFGDARVGVAASDETEFLATAVCSLNVTGVNDAVRKCADKIKELGGEKIVCGLPYNMNGSESFRAEKTRVFADKLKEATGLELEFMDERLSTVEAYTYMNITDFKSSKRRAVIDAMSAQIILQSYLDKIKK
ncbi:MAG: Holliday junction resolvase RuvX [Clostridia bacterium]|nr:Holliday junction resolvase RuvX [Clostridia bacterium]MBQ3154429.1 Holliday junction resolvase RuvX [Clostridia bacterium]